MNHLCAVALGVCCSLCGCAASRGSAPEERSAESDSHEPGDTVWEYVDRLENPRGVMVRRRGMLRNGRKEGVWLTYDVYGDLRAIETFRGDIENGPSAYYWISVDKELGGVMTGMLWTLEGRRHGVNIELYDSGIVKEVSEYRNGEMDGAVREYHENGNLRVRGMMRGGRPVGLYESWHADGSLNERGQYVDGRRSGLWIKRDEDGRESRVMW